MRMRVPRILRARRGSRKARSFSISETNKGCFWLRTSVRLVLFFCYLDAPAEIRTKGFWEVLRYWLARTELQVRTNWQPYRVALLGNYGSGLRLKRDINRFLAAEDPYGTAAFVRQGLKEGALRGDVDSEMIVSLLEWTVERFEDALLTEELDPGLFHRAGFSKKKTTRRRDHFLRVLQGAIGNSRPAVKKHRIVAKAH